jgi:hypothetical protein
MATKFKVPSHKVKSKRKLSKELESVIDNWLLENKPKEFKAALAIKDALALTDLAGDALTGLRVREKTNKNDGKMVELIQKVGGGKKGLAWCLYQGQTVVAYAETKTGIVSKFPYTGSCASLRKYAKKIPSIVIDLEDSLPGDQWVAVYKTGKGHTGNFTGWANKKKTKAWLNEGNTTAGKAGEKVIREGGGSYQTERDVPGIWVMGVRPFPVLANSPAQDPIKKPVKVAGEIPKYGDRSDAVFTLQRAYNAWAKKNKKKQIEVDGWFLKETKAAMQTVQKANKLPGSGRIGTKTMALLGL